jgi:S1-C subfamily serine protease
MINALLLAAAIWQPQAGDRDGLDKSVQAELLRATVRIANAQKKTVGSGVLLGKSGPAAYVLTAAHVVDGADSVEVHIFAEDTSSKPRVYPQAKVVARRREGNQDLALLRIADYGGEVKALSICAITDLPKDKSLSAFAIGCPDFKPPRLRGETVQAVQAAKRAGSGTVKLWQGKQKPTAGESGGPLVNARGQLLGICSGGQGEHGYFCHLEDIHSFLRSSGLTWALEPKR